MLVYIIVIILLFMVNVTVLVSVLVVMSFSTYGIKECKCLSMQKGSDHYEDLKLKEENNNHAGETYT